MVGDTGRESYVKRWLKSPVHDTNIYSFVTESLHCTKRIRVSLHTSPVFESGDLRAGSLISKEVSQWVNRLLSIIIEGHDPWLLSHHLFYQSEDMNTLEILTKKFSCNTNVLLVVENRGSVIFQMFYVSVGNGVKLIWMTWGVTNLFTVYSGHWDLIRQCFSYRRRWVRKVLVCEHKQHELR